LPGRGIAQAAAVHPRATLQKRQNFAIRLRTPRSSERETEVIKRSKKALAPQELVITNSY